MLVLEISFDDFLCQMLDAEAEQNRGLYSQSQTAVTQSAKCSTLPCLFKSPKLICQLIEPRVSKVIEHGVLCNHHGLKQTTQMDPYSNLYCSLKSFKQASTARES